MAYLDTSAFAKLSLGEPEEAALRRVIAGHDSLVSSALLRIEALRACARYGEEERARAEVALAGVSLVPIDEAVLEAAARLEPTTLRSLGAIHLATALSLGGDLGVMYAYDERLAAAAREAGVRVETPV